MYDDLLSSTSTKKSKYWSLAFSDRTHVADLMFIWTTETDRRGKEAKIDLCFQLSTDRWNEAERLSDVSTCIRPPMDGVSRQIGRVPAYTGDSDSAKNSSVRLPASNCTSGYWLTWSANISKADGEHWCQANIPYRPYKATELNWTEMNAATQCFISPGFVSFYLSSVALYAPLDILTEWPKFTDFHLKTDRKAVSLIQHIT